MDKLTNGMNLVVNEIGTKIAFQPGVLIGGEIDHECCKQRGIGYYLELIFMLAPFFKKGGKITLRGVTNNEVRQFDVLNSSQMLCASVNIIMYMIVI